MGGTCNQKQGGPGIEYQLKITYQLIEWVIESRKNATGGEWDGLLARSTDIRPTGDPDAREKT